MPTPKQQISIDEFRANYDEYVRRMEAGETFSFIDFDQHKHKLLEPINGEGKSIDIDSVRI